MDGGHYDEDDEEEVVAFLPPRQPRDIQQIRESSTLRPLQVMNSSTNRRLPDLPEDPATFARKMGVLLSILVLLCGVYGWSSWETSRNTSTQQYHELSVDNIEHWCLDPKSTHDCECANPLEPQERFDHKTWRLAHDGNTREALEAEDGVDVVFLGDSIIEGWRGLSLGLPVAHKKANIAVFDKLFRQDQGADFQGLPLGIAGDKSSHLLWRIKHGEVPDSLQPPVWWILVGTNDFMRSDYCSPEVVTMGVERVAEEMRFLRPDAMIVVNGLLPRSDGSSGGKLRDPSHKTVWQGIEEVNKSLQQYCERHRNVEFFDATNIFVKKDNNFTNQEAWYIPNALMADHLHPTALGYEKWGQQIIKKLHTLLDAKNNENGRKPVPESR